MRKRLPVAIFLILALAPALAAQRFPISSFDTATDKILVSGGVNCLPDSQISARISLNYKGRAITRAKVWLNKWELIYNDDGTYVGVHGPFNPSPGKVLEIAVEIPSSPIRAEKPPFTGRQVLASLSLNNVIEWVFPAPGGTIDLAAYPMGLATFRWNFTGTALRGGMDLYAGSGERVYGVITTGESTGVPTSLMAPGREYYAEVSTLCVRCGIQGFFKLTKYAAADPAFDSGKGIILRQKSRCRFSTRPAK